MDPPHEPEGSIGLANRAGNFAGPFSGNLRRKSEESNPRGSSPCPGFRDQLRTFPQTLPIERRQVVFGLGVFE